MALLPSLTNAAFPVHSCSVGCRSFAGHRDTNGSRCFPNSFNFGDTGPRSHATHHCTARRCPVWPFRPCSCNATCLSSSATCSPAAPTTNRCRCIECSYGCFCRPVHEPFPAAPCTSQSSRARLIQSRYHTVCMSI